MTRPLPAGRPARRNAAAIAAAWATFVIGSCSASTPTLGGAASTPLTRLPTITIDAPETPGGFAEHAGLTGGLGRPAYMITSTDDDGPGTYRDALSEGDRYIRFDESLDGTTIELRRPVIAPGSNLTLDGSGVDVTISKRATRFSGTNVVIAGLRFSAMDAGDNEDALTFLDASETQVFGIYGNVFEDATDGLVDVIWNRGNDVHATMCGNLFQHHDKAVLIQSGADSREGGTYHITMCRNHWLDVYQRTPLAREALVHQYNSVFERYGKPNGSGSGSKAGRGSQLLVENSVAIPRAVDEETWEGERVRSPRAEFAGPQEGSDGDVRIVGPLLQTTGDLTAVAIEHDAADVFVAPYEHDLVPATPALRDVVTSAAGRCEPSGNPEAVVPCTPLLLLETGDPIRAIVDGDVADVSFVFDGVALDGATPDGEGWTLELHDGSISEIHRVHATATAPDGRPVESPEVLVAFVSR